MKYVRVVVYLIVFVYTLLAFLNPKKMYVDRFTHDMHFIEWVLLQPFPSMYSSEITLKTDTTNSSNIHIVHHPMAYLLCQKSECLSDSINYKLSVRYREHKSVKRYTIFQDSLFIKKNKEVRY